MPETTLKIGEIAQRISSHLRRIEQDVKNSDTKEAGQFYYAGARAAGSKIGIRYVAYQFEYMLTKAEALEYLAWLDAGNTGKHHKANQARKIELKPEVHP